MDSLISDLKNYLLRLETDDQKKIQDVATSISSRVIAEEIKGEELSPVLLAIEHLALDLEVPRDRVKKYPEKKAKLIELIKSL